MCFQNSRENFSNQFQKVTISQQSCPDIKYFIFYKFRFLTGVYDLLVIEAMERGRIETVETLPTVEGRGVFSLNLFLFRQLFKIITFQNYDLIDFCFIYPKNNQLNIKLKLSQSLIYSTQPCRKKLTDNCFWT